MTTLEVLRAIIHSFAMLGATHPYHAQQGANGVVATHKFLTIVCQIPAHLHGIFHCSGWVRRP